MSQPVSSSAKSPRGVIVQKPKTTVYTVMIVLSALMMALGCLFLYLEWVRYE
ncbi:hypothetical protein Mal64_23680 [Pseudobythopirellula maris]|uniref:Uncharacterized protein n=1 Tax=Pseudobythopirellula maris TaxID=2527991 RepID=A0A5C5ZNW2_9BACT|nr:hypothetical protein [Pseudobythopirellula maris]TWT88880.1 hypothetical protein Mal64_23680 [Pseudobythopirellula maris]